MSYTIDIDERAHADIAVLPGSELLAFAEALTSCSSTPWNGRPINPDNPLGPVRTLAFGASGMVTYLVLDSERRVDVLIVASVG